MKKNLTLLQGLYKIQQELNPDPYLYAHSRNIAVIHRHVYIYEKLACYLSGTNTILDWGCRHAADACMARNMLGDSVEIHGCDVDNEGYSAFFQYSKIVYSKLDHYYHIYPKEKYVNKTKMLIDNTIK